MQRQRAIAVLLCSLGLAACGSNQEAPPPHSDSIDFTIDQTNALPMAISVYAALGAYIPYTAANAMAADGSVNNQLCASGSVGGEMQMNADGSMGMEMTFQQCRLSTPPTSNGYELTVDGRCASTLDADGTRHLEGERVDFSLSTANDPTQGFQLGVHNFELTLKNDQLQSGEAYLHYQDSSTEATVHVVATGFAGTAPTPSAGTLTIHGQNSAAKLVINADGSFDLSLDLDGDGNFETSEITVNGTSLASTGLDWNNYIGSRLP